MDLQLTGKRALVTGSSSGIGAAIAKQLAAEGAVVVVHGRDKARTAAVGGEIRAAGGDSFEVIGELTSDTSANRVCAEVDSLLGGVDILVNNAGGAGGRNPARGKTPGFFDLMPEDWVGAYEHNLVSAVRTIKQLGPGMMDRGWGRIIQIASSAATVPSTVNNDYAAAKGALVTLTVGLSKTLAHTGVTANTVSPGMILTPQTLADNSHKEAWLRVYARSRGWDDSLSTEELEQQWAKEWNVPAGKAGRVENITAIVSVLASPLGGFVTGANFRVDGGENPSVN